MLVGAWERQMKASAEDLNPSWVKAQEIIGRLYADINKTFEAFPSRTIEEVEKSKKGLNQCFNKDLLSDQVNTLI